MAFLAGVIRKAQAVPTGEQATGRRQIQRPDPILTQETILDRRTQEPVTNPAIEAGCCRNRDDLTGHGNRTPEIQP